jgi:hypothetical protein
MVDDAGPTEDPPENEACRHNDRLAKPVSAAALATPSPASSFARASSAATVSSAARIASACATGLRGLPISARNPRMRSARRRPAAVSWLARDVGSFVVLDRRIGCGSGSTSPNRFGLVCNGFSGIGRNVSRLPVRCRRHPPCQTRYVIRGLPWTWRDAPASPLKRTPNHVR